MNDNNIRSGGKANIPVQRHVAKAKAQETSTVTSTIATTSPTRKRRKSPARAALNVIPSPERLQMLVDKALDALKQGIFWDRGSIINIIL